MLTMMDRHGGNRNNSNSNSDNAAATTCPDSVFDIAVRWYLAHAVTSNTELATFSNVSRRFRQLTQQHVLAQVQDWPDCQHLAPSAMLLLPSMARQLMLQCQQQQQLDNDNNDNNNDTTVTASTTTLPESEPETFCVAWFHSDGICELPVSLSDKSLDDDGADDDNAYSFARPVSAASLPSPRGNDTTTCGPVGENGASHVRAISPVPGNLLEPPSPPPTKITSYWFEEQQQQQQPPQQSSSQHFVACVNEWRGYQTAWDVLRPFGYAATFVHNVLRSCHPRAAAVLHQAVTAGQTTFAVRGVAMARPEGYCHCFDEVEASMDQSEIGVNKEKSVRNNNHSGTPHLVTDHGIVEPYNAMALARRQRRDELHRQVLPRVLVRQLGSTTISPPSLSSSLSSSLSFTNRISRSVQFLNADGGHAVCMVTPPFACGALPAPLTLVWVGIATEDGCFVSSLHHRCEVGHLYPPHVDSSSSSIQLSPICVATSPAEPRRVVRENSTPVVTALETDPQQAPVPSDDDDSSCENDSDQQPSCANMICTCVFKEVGSKFDNVSDNVETNDDSSARETNSNNNGSGHGNNHQNNNNLPPHQIYHGCVGPGEWHCYTAIIDGASTRIRVDGIEERIETETLKQDPSIITSVLDGLTIGSDHDFGMTLCSGYGSGGEGQGAIAELAVFKGRLDNVDIEILETMFMKKHGITPIALTHEYFWQEHDWRRKAHNMFVAQPIQQPQSHSDKSTRQQHSSTPCQEMTPSNNTLSNHREGVPLRFLTRHKSVAWQLQNAVSGEIIHPNKIGSRPGVESSDW